MKMSYNDTRRFIEFVLKEHIEDCRQRLHQLLKQSGFNEGQFYSAIAKHGPGMKMSPTQWSDLLTRIPNRILYSQLDLAKLLTEDQIKQLSNIKTE